MIPTLANLALHKTPFPTGVVSDAERARVLAAGTQNGEALFYASDELKKDREVV